MNAIVNAPRPRATVATTMHGLEIVIPAARQWFAVAFLTFWLAGWSFGGLAAARQAFSAGSPPGSRAFMTFWLIGWLCGEAWSLLIVAWNLAGREVIRVAPSQLEIRREIGGIGRSRNYAIADMRNLRVGGVQVSATSRNRNFRFPGLGGGVLAFDYGSATVRFGNDLVDGEAATIADAIRDRAPSLQGAAG